MSECEWNPRWNRPALDIDPKHGEAVWSVGKKPYWHLCESCANLPVFKRSKRRVRLDKTKGGDE